MHKLKKNVSKILTVFLLLLVFLFYLWTVSSNEKPFHFDFTTGPNAISINYLDGKINPIDRTGINYDSYGYHHLLADAFLHHQLHLRVEPSPHLLALPDPYNPRLNNNLRLHDASLYQGHYYLYFTPIVALLFIIPFKVLFGYFISEQLLMACLCFVGFLLSYFTLKKMVELGKGQMSYAMAWLSILALATATTVPYLLRRPAVYELCIASGYAFLMMGLYLLVGSIKQSINTRLCGRLFFTGLFLGLCIAARPNQCFACGVLIIGYFILRFQAYRPQLAMLALHLAAFALPLLGIGSAMCWYNYARFGSIFEFGMHYQLAGINAHVFQTIAWSNIPFAMPIYLLQPILLKSVFPYVFTNPKPINITGFPFPLYFGFEPVIGLLYFPVYVLLAFPIIFRKTLRKWVPTLFYLSCFVIIAGLVSLLGASVILGATMRYIVDFSPFLLLPTLALLIECRNMQLISIFSLIVTVFISMIVSIATSFTGYGDSLKNQNPTLYLKLERVFNLS